MTKRAARVEPVADSRERRIHPRTSYAGAVFFASRNRIYEGRLINFSAGGLCIRAPEPVAPGDFITVAPPYEGAASAKCNGMVVWSRGKVFGLEFNKTRTNNDPDARRRRNAPVAV